MTPDSGELKTNTKLAQRIKAKYDRDLKRKWQAAQKEKKRKKKKSKKAKKQDHEDPNAPLKGVLGKGDRYAQRAHDYIKDQNGRGVYDVFDYPHLAEVKDLVEKVCKFPYGPIQNFNPDAKYRGKKARQKHPYAWEAHHMLPGSAFYAELDGTPIFTSQQQDLILQSDYNITHGHNMIMLPDQDWACPIHVLIQHPGDHPEYTKKVMTDLKTIASDLQSLIDKKKPHGELTASVFEDLKNLEKNFWTFLVKLGRKTVLKRIAGIKYVHPNVRFEPEKGESVYTFGALY